MLPTKAKLLTKVLNAVNERIRMRCDSVNASRDSFVDFIQERTNSGILIGWIGCFPLLYGY